MGKGATKNKSSCGFSISDRKSLLTSKSEVSLRKVHNLGRPFDGGGSGGAAAGGVGPTGSNSGGANEVVVGHTIHRDEYVSSSPSPCLDTQNTSVGSNNFQPFHIFSPYSANPYKFPGEMVPLFTNAQWTELERQAMIYKYMVSSVPVPPHLLHPSYAAGLVEPGRCKRTDGKKWRCSRDVAPHQKYCERHLHRGRPRSRKPVEINNNSTNQNNGGENHKKPRLQQKQPKQQLSPAANDDKQPILLFSAKTNLSTISATPSYKGSNRDPGLMMESEMVVMKRALLESSNVGFSNYEGSSAIFHQDYMDQHVSYSNYPEAPIGLIDAWSVDNNNNLSSITNQKVNIESADLENFNPWLNLSIAMAGGGNVLGDEMGSVRVGGGANFHDEGGARWLSPVGWEQFGPGGPLAEALLRTPVSPHNSVSGPTATAVSSPSGVIQRMLFSNSDCSVCNSPSEIAFQRIK